MDDGSLAVWVNDAYMQAVDEISKANPDYFVKLSTSSTVNAQQEYTLPTDFDRLMMVNIQIGGTWKRPLPLQGIDQVPNHSNVGDYSWADPKYYLMGNYIGFLPIPAENGSSNLKIWYAYTPAEMTADADIPAIPSRFHGLLKFGAYANFLDQDDEHAAAEVMRRRFEARLAQMVESISERQVEEPKTVQITTNSDLYIDDLYL